MIKLLKEQLKTGDIGHVYLFYGEEAYLRRHYEGMLKKAASGGMDELNHHIITSDFFTSEAFFEAVEAPAQFAERSFVWVKNLTTYTAADLKAIEKALSERSDEVTVLFSYEETIEAEKKCKDLLKMLKSMNAVICDFKIPNEAELIPWALRRLSASAKTMRKEDIAYLISITDVNMTSLAGELDKLISSTDLENITRDKIEGLVEKSFSAKIYELTDSILKGNFKLAFELMHGFLKNGDEPVFLVAAISSALIRLSRLKIAMDEGMGEAGKLKFSGISGSFQMKKMEQTLTGLKEGYLRYALEAALSCDLELKSSRTSSAVLMDMFFGKLMTYSVGGKAL